MLKHDVQRLKVKRSVMNHPTAWTFLSPLVSVGQRIDAEELICRRCERGEANSLAGMSRREAPLASVLVEVVCFNFTYADLKYTLQTQSWNSSFQRENAKGVVSRSYSLGTSMSTFAQHATIIFQDQAKKLKN